MRTTLNIDPIVLNAARRLAQARSMALGDVISELAAKGLSMSSQPNMGKPKNGFPVFSVPKSSMPFGPEQVKIDEDRSDSA